MGAMFNGLLFFPITPYQSDGEVDVTELAARVLLPDIHHVIELGDVAFLVVGEIAEHGLEVHAGMHFIGDLFRID